MIFFFQPDSIYKPEKNHPIKQPENNDLLQDDQSIEGKSRNG